MKSKLILSTALLAALVLPSVASAVCYEITGYYPWDPYWINAAVKTTSYGSGAALRAVGSGSQTAARFRSDTSSGLETRTHADGARGLLTSAEQSSGTSVALEASSSSPGGAVVQLRGQSGHLVDGYSNGQEVFRVANDGTVTVRGQPILQKGPTGDPGSKGPNGPAGYAGSRGAGAGADSYPVCAEAGSCHNFCVQGIADSHPSPCNATAAGIYCQWLGEDGICCVCER